MWRKCRDPAAGTPARQNAAGIHVQSDLDNVALGSEFVSFYSETGHVLLRQFHLYGLG
jgi:hypothetical protein